MFLHTHKVISRLFNRYVDKLDELGPVNLVGPSGLGKLSYIKEFIRHIECEKYAPFSHIEEPYRGECSCEICKIILEDIAADILILSGNEPIEELRNKLNNFIDSFPVEFKFRYLIVHDLDRFNNNELDVFLNILEEPLKYIKIFTTTKFMEEISDPVKSRVQSFELNLLSKEDLEVIIKEYREFEYYKVIFNKYDFRTISQLVYYHRFDFEGLFKKFFVDIGSSYRLAVEIDIFLKDIKDQFRGYEGEIREFFLRFYLDRVYEFCDLNKDNVGFRCLKNYLQDKLILLYLETLFNYVAYQRQHYVNIQEQIFMFFNTIYMLKKMVRL